MDLFSILKGILTFTWIAGLIVEIVYVIKWLSQLMRENGDPTRRKRYAIITMASLFISVSSLVGHFVVSELESSARFEFSSVSTFSVESDSIHDGVWDQEIGSKKGNLSPEIHWQAVDTARCYAIVMIDPDGGNWLHWSVVTDQAGSESGRYKSESEGYVGPYPPEGTHRYDVYVFAMKGESYGLGEKLDQAGADIETIASELNSGTEPDNLISYGYIEGIYSAE